MLSNCSRGALMSYNDRSAQCKQPTSGSGKWHVWSPYSKDIIKMVHVQGRRPRMLNAGAEGVLDQCQGELGN